MNSPIPSQLERCPLGLECLIPIDQLLVKQELRFFEILTGFENNNKYSIQNYLGQTLFLAVEINDCLTRNVCFSWRPFHLKILDNFGNEVIHLHRPLACDSCCFPCCLQSIEVLAPNGNVIGTIEQQWTFATPKFKIKNHLGESVFEIKGMMGMFSCGDVDFKVLSLAGEQIGRISKKWSGFIREIFTDADFFGITFPMNLDVRMKAVLLGACILIDFMYFEKTVSES